MVATGRPVEVEHWTERYNPRGIDFAVSHVVMPFDVIEIDCVSNTGLLVQIAEITVQMRVIDDATQVALEMPEIHGVETD